MSAAGAGCDVWRIAGQPPAGPNAFAKALLNAGGTRLVPWTIELVAMLLGLPLFFEAAVVLMMPIVLTVGAPTRKDPGGLKGNPYLLAGLPVFAGIGVMHVLVPPHPGPMVAIDAIGADMGTTLVIGILLAFPVAILAGPLFTYWIAPRASASPPADLVERLTRRDTQFGGSPGIGVTVMTILFPILLMMGKAGVDLALPVGHPCARCSNSSAIPSWRCCWRYCRACSALDFSGQRHQDGR